ncbi:RND-family efflux transporter MFP component (plasmid) [Octadecabacter antarcticus 307]|uniref:RND-family efflux transporter MFP component n=1 Tax=Octadecabacter antarcticus 307 TaxID=391626 RepID=M9RKB0_9RHOB|nr:efflux RND transporter periplasmic adaptor subunit [Octadecabacter antarcticus]AGI70270.1 RND-family efflux transporter MFP component [Octadecabacter antarcticus 307]
MAKFNTEPKLYKRVLKRLGILTGTGIVIGGCVVATISATSLIADRANAVDAPAPVPLISVAAVPAQLLDGYDVQRSFAGLTEANRSVSVSFEQGGTVDQILVDEGDIVSQGDVLAILDTGLLDAERHTLGATRSAVSVRLELAITTQQRHLALRNSGNISQQSVDEADAAVNDLTAQLAQVDAQLATLDVRVAKSQITAPFDGQIATRAIDEGTALSAGVPVVTILESGSVLFRVGVDPRLADTLEVGSRHRVEVSGQTHDVILESVRPDLDPQTRTRTLVFSFDGESPTLRQAGVLNLTQRISQSGFSLPLTALKEGVRGLWTVQALVPDDAGSFRVQSEAIEIIHADEARVFVRGTLQDGVQIVEGGTHRLVSGQLVRLLDGSV